MKDPYEILGVGADADADELKKAFRRRARECHPDSDPDNPWAEDEFKEISGAYGLLSDKHLRARYDRGEISGDGTRRQPGSASGATQSKAKPRKHVPSPPRGRKRSKTAGLKIKGADVEYTLKVAFLEAAKGAVRHISMATGKRLEVTIPPATEDGAILRLKGEGMPGIGGGGDGDAYVEIRVEPDPVFRREKNDIHVEVPVTLSEAMLGGKIEAPTIDGIVNVTVPKGSNTGTQLRLKGKGLKGARKGSGGNAPRRGDQFVHLKVMLPKKPDKDFIRFMEEWSPDHPYTVRPKTKKGR
jgi:DnaJ-class molecular chaperone